MKTLGNPSNKDICGFVTTTAYERLEHENAKLRELVKAAWILFLKYGAVSENELPEIDRVRESLSELGIKEDE